ncbi:alpha/beta hydrolase [Rothia sp. LK2588]|uniref:alpha/beta hydrolase fold domain-containing protein n=1 Tax=Rothia sp. LK2588 TaxID=3114369 RepID=UPI0034D01DE9
MKAPQSGFYTRNHTDSHSYDFYPAEGERAPLLIYVHGGAWRFGDKSALLSSENGVHRLREVFAEAGFACASINYRLSDEAQFPSQIHDVKAAIRHFRKHAEVLGVDPNRIIVAGGSAGAHLTMLAAATGNLGDEYYDGPGADVSAEVAAAICIYGVSDLRTIFEDRPLCGFPEEHPDDDGAEWRLLGSTYPAPAGSDAELNWSKAQPIDLLNRAEASGLHRCAPIAFVHGVADSCVPSVQSARAYEALRDRGIPTMIELVDEADHADLRVYADPILEKVLAWVHEL